MCRKACNLLAIDPSFLKSGKASGRRGKELHKMQDHVGDYFSRGRKPLRK